MSIWQQHIKYLQDNPEGYWFKRKLYGWGWTPATKAGWLVTLLFALCVISTAVAYEQQLIPLSNMEFSTILVVALFLFLVTVVKTGETPSWQWGQSDESEN